MSKLGCNTPALVRPCFSLSLFRPHCRPGIVGWMHFANFFPIRFPSSEKQITTKLNAASKT